MKLKFFISKMVNMCKVYKLILTLLIFNMDIFVKTVQKIVIVAILKHIVKYVQKILSKSINQTLMLIIMVMFV